MTSSRPLCPAPRLARSRRSAARRLLGLTLLPLGATLATAARAAAATTPAPRLLASFSILADLLREVAPPDFQVESLVGPDADAHAFEPTPADARRLAQADLVLVNGLGYEGWLTRLVKVSGYRGPLVVASDGITALKAPTAGQDGHGHGPGHSHGPAGGQDPHAWQDLAHVRHYVRHIAQALAQRWPQRAGEIGTRRDAYLARLDQLEQRLAQLLAPVPPAQRRVICSHDAFAYLGRAWGIQFYAPRGWTSHSEPSAAAVARLVRQIREQQVRAVFLENMSDRRLIERIAREGGVRVGGTLYSDALSAPGGPADSFLKLYEHNLRAIAAALAP